MFTLYDTHYRLGALDRIELRTTVPSYSIHTCTYLVSQLKYMQVTTGHINTDNTLHCVPSSKRLEFIKQRDLPSATKFTTKGEITLSGKIQVLQTTWHLNHTLKNEKLRKKSVPLKAAQTRAERQQILKPTWQMI